METRHETPQNFNKRMPKFRKLNTSSNFYVNESRFGLVLFLVMDKINAFKSDFVKRNF